MTAREFQKELVADLQFLFADDYFKSPPSESESDTADTELSAVSVFSQELPYLYTGDDDQPWPYVIVRLIGGGIENPTSAHKVDVMLIVGIYENSTDGIGHEAVLQIMEKVQAHYQQDPILGCFAYDMKTPFDWTLQDEPSYPYYFGACYFSFLGTAPRTRSIYS